MTRTTAHRPVVRERTGAHPWVRRPGPAGPPDLTGELAVRVARAALAEHPGAVVRTVEVDDGGRFTARLATPLGERVVVRLDADLAVLGWIVEPV
ncbi:hypothetical protein [Trujillonella humicola]|uniref:hypothetical protein n=1 Tax=Trujillonella humicola TaxID=3383699 RepID=UPI003905A135